MKKLLCIVLTVIQLSLFISVCAENNNDTIIYKLLTDWTTYLGDLEAVYGRSYDALSYTKAYCESRNWEDLIRARTCALYVKDVLQYYATTPVEPSMTNEDYQFLLSEGFDIGDVQVEINNYNSTILTNAEYQNLVSDDFILTADIQYDSYDYSNKLNILRWNEYILYLMEIFYSVDNILYLNNFAEIEQKFIIQYAKLAYLENNMVILELPEDTKEWYCQWCEENLPFIMSCYSELFTSENDAANEMISVLDEMESGLLSLEELVTSSEISLLESYNQVLDLSEKANSLRQQVDEGTLTQEEADQQMVEASMAIHAEITNLNHIELIVSYPLSCELNVQKLYYYWVDQEGNASSVTYPFQFEQLPNCFYAEFDDVTVNDYYQYALYLMDMGFEVESMDDTAILLKPDDSTMMLVSFDNSTMKIYVKGNQVCFIMAGYTITKAWINQKSND